MWPLRFCKILEVNNFPLWKLHTTRVLNWSTRYPRILTIFFVILQHSRHNYSIIRRLRFHGAKIVPIITRNKKPLLISRKIEIRRVEIILPWTLRSTFWLLTTRFYTTNVCKRYIYAHVAFSKERTKPTIIYSVAVNLAADSLPTLVSTRAKSAKQTRIQGDRLFSRCSFFFSLSLSQSFFLFPIPFPSPFSFHPIALSSHLSRVASARIRCSCLSPSPFAPWNRNEYSLPVLVFTLLLSCSFERNPPMVIHSWNLTRRFVANSGQKDFEACPPYF